jgi:hypothetical protein
MRCASLTWITLPAHKVSIHTLVPGQIVESTWSCGECEVGGWLRIAPVLNDILCERSGGQCAKDSEDGCEGDHDEDWMKE